MQQKPVDYIFFFYSVFFITQLGMSALHFAAMNNQVEICDDLLKSGINKDARTKADRSPLHLACFYGNEKIVQMLLAKKCAVNTRDMVIL